MKKRGSKIREMIRIKQLQMFDNLTWFVFELPQ